MQVTSISDFRKDLKKYIDNVDQNHEPLIVTRSDDVTVVVLSLEDYNALDETDYLLSSPANAKRLLESVKELESGGGEKKHVK